MIWLYGNLVLAWIKRWIIPPSTDPGLSVPKMDPNAPCPYCGWRDGKMTAVIDPNDKRGWRVRHACNVCSGWWDLDPIAKVLADRK